MQCETKNGDKTGEKNQIEKLDSQKKRNSKKDFFPKSV